MTWRAALALTVLLCVAGCGVKSELMPPDANKPPPKSQPNPSKPPSPIGQ
jgi:predicted small lipoprotein YifL